MQGAPATACMQPHLNAWLAWLAAWAVTHSLTPVEASLPACSGQTAYDCTRSSMSPTGAGQHALASRARGTTQWRAPIGTTAALAGAASQWPLDGAAGLFRALLGLPLDR
jgi:hypothetical protein